MGPFFGLLALLVVVLVLASGVLGVIAFVMVLSQSGRLKALQQELNSVVRRLRRLEAEPEEAPTPEPTPEPPPPAEKPKPEEPAEPQPEPEPQPRAQRAESAPTAAGLGGIEQAIGQKWLTWAGVLALLLAAGFFIKYAFDQEWIGPTTRVLIGLVAGIAMVGSGEHFVRRDSRFFGQGLIGGGLAVLYLSLFASFALYHLVAQPVAFGAMVAVTALGMALAAAHDARSISFLALIGGLLTPVLLSTGEDRRDVLFAYLLLLDFGVVGLTLWKRWRGLDVAAFVGTAALFGAWFGEFYTDAAMLPTMLWLGGFYALFLLLACGNDLRRRTSPAPERFCMAVADGALAFACACAVLQEHEVALGSGALAMAATYLTPAVLAGRRVPEAERTVFGFVAMALLLATVSAPLYLDGWPVTLVWAGLGPVLVYLGYRFAYRPVRAWGFIVLVLAAVRISAVHWPLHDGAFTAFLNGPFLFALCVSLAAWAAALVHQFLRGAAQEEDRTLKLALVIGGAYVAMLLASSELTTAIATTGERWLAHHVAAAPWTLGAALLLFCGLRLRSVPVRLAGIPPLAVAGLLMLAAYAHGYRGDYSLFLSWRFGIGLLTVLVALGYRLLPGLMEVSDGKDTAGTALFWSGLVGLPILLSLETFTCSMASIVDAESARWTALMSVSIVWAVYASALLAVGFWRDVRSIRIAGLLLFGLTALKVVLMDMATVAQIYRIISFFVLGALMIAGAYLYHRVEKQLAEAD